jgi:DNA-binding PadR family transcriptional regulator
LSTIAPAGHAPAALDLNQPGSYLNWDVDPREEKRPARRYYRLTAGGAAEASAAVANARRPRGAALRGLAREAGTA